MNMKYEELLLNLKIRPQDQLFGHVGILFGLVVIHFIKGWSWILDLIIIF